MAKLPNRESLGSAPSPRTGRPIARVDTTAVPKAQARFGETIAKAGMQIAANQNDVDPAEKFEIERRFQELKWAERTALDDQIRSFCPAQI